MRRFLAVRLDALNFQGFHRPGLALDFFFQPLQQLGLFHHDAVQLLDLMFEVREVGFQFISPPGIFVSHAAILPAPPAEVETVKKEDCSLQRFAQLWQK